MEKTNHSKFKTILKEMACEVNQLSNR